MTQAMPRLPWVPETDPVEGRHLKFGETISVMADGIKYEWSIRPVGGVHKPSLVWIDQGVRFLLAQSRPTNGDMSWTLAAVLDGGSTLFEWVYKDDAWLAVPEVIRRQVERACNAVTEEFDRVRSERRRIADRHRASEEVRAAAARRKLLEQLGDD